MGSFQIEAEHAMIADHRASGDDELANVARRGPREQNAYRIEIVAKAIVMR